ncbi:transport [Kocuria rosea subsp. polaris]|uniref:Transport n=1 Tax=Kocuria rosea subsp. polaris TaxID=136273 RepID=A0A0W8I194_KOCRO|nr:formate/nitrite transporter family protein [Kocuria polaris]KUG51264.1 transport [Kocuria polaris]
MSAPDPAEIYDRAKNEGARRLSMPPLEQASTGFIAGVTIVFGIVALAMAEELITPGFGTGVVFLVIGRSELFTENFFDPVAAAIDRQGPSVWLRLGRLWVLVLMLNLVGGTVMAAVFTVQGALPAGAHEVLVSVAEDIAAKSGWATFARAVAAGTLLTLLSYLLHAADSATARIVLAYLVGVFLALGPFDHVVVSGLHLLFGTWLGAAVTVGDLGQNFVLAVAGNLVGGLLLMTLTHTVQAKSSPGSD